MAAPRPAEVGMPIDEVETPALVVELDALDRNLAAMATQVREAGLCLRPHAKSHKCPELARLQIALGAVGVCCQKVSEAEAMVRGGCGNVLVTNEIIGPRKLDRLAALARQAWIGVCADDAENVRDIACAAETAGSEVTVLVEIDVGAGRCGVPPGARALELAREVAACNSLRFGGLQAYHGAAQHLRDFSARRAAIEEAARHTRDTVELLAGAGIACDIVGGAGTGTYPFEASSGVYNELQPGSYVFMDADYARNRDESGKEGGAFAQSLFILTTVMSRPAHDRAVLDAGLKAFSVDSGHPTLWRHEDVRITSVSDEHSVLTVSGGAARLPIGEKIRLVPGHCDPTVNLYDWLVGLRGDRVECLWPVAARGAVI